MSERAAEILKRAEELKFAAAYGEAIALLEGLLILEPECVPALEEIADNELSLGRYDRAERAAKQALALDSESCNAFYILGFLASHREQWKESVELLRKANELAPNDPEILRCLGWSLFSSGEQVQGLVTLERALNLDSDSPLILCDLGVVYLKLKQFQKSIAILQRALEIDPTSERAKECLEMARKIGKSEGA